MRVELAPSSVHCVDEHKATLRPQQSQIFRHIVAADHVEDHVQTFAFQRRLEIFVAVVDRALGARQLTSPALLVAARGRERARLVRSDELDGCKSNATAPAMHQKTLSRLKSPALEYIVPNGEHRFG